MFKGWGWGGEAITEAREKEKLTSYLLQFEAVEPCSAHEAWLSSTSASKGFNTVHWG